MSLDVCGHAGNRRPCDRGIWNSYVGELTMEYTPESVAAHRGLCLASLSGGCSTATTDQRGIVRSNVPDSDAALFHGRGSAQAATHRHRILRCAQRKSLCLIRSRADVGLVGPTSSAYGTRNPIVAHLQVPVKRSRACEVGESENAHYPPPPSLSSRGRSVSQVDRRLVLVPTFQRLRRGDHARGADGDPMRVPVVSVCHGLAS